MTADMTWTIMALAEHGNNGHGHSYTVDPAVMARHNDGDNNGWQRRQARRWRERPPQGMTSAAEGHQRSADWDCVAFTYICPSVRPLQTGREARASLPQETDLN